MVVQTKVVRDLNRELLVLDTVSIDFAMRVFWFSSCFQRHIQNRSRGFLSVGETLLLRYFVGLSRPEDPTRIPLVKLISEMADTNWLCGFGMAPRNWSTLYPGSRTAL